MKAARILIIGIISVFLCNAGFLYAQEPYTPPLTLLNAATATGLGSEVDSGIHSTKWSCTVTWSGTTPTNTVVQVHLADKSGVYDETNYDAQATVTASPWRFYISNKGARYAKGNYVSKSGGDATTAVTLECASGGN